MGKIFLFPGQGAQYPRMGLDLWETSERVKKLFALCSDVMSVDMKGLLETADAETLKRTDVAQPAITLVNLAASEYLAERGIEPCGTAGFSLGEYAAMVEAGILSLAHCFRLVQERGKAMQEAADALAKAGGGAGMAAVVGLTPEKIAETLAGANIADLYAANSNSSKQTVLSGTARALDEAESLFKTAGAKRFIRLAVAGPFHSPLIQSAADAFAPYLDTVTFHDPRLPLYSNVTGAEVKSGEEAKRLAPLQIVSPVQWVSVESAIIAAGGFDGVLETGPGAVLGGLWADTGCAIRCVSAGTKEAIETLAG